MPLNPGYEFMAAEKKYDAAQTDDEKIIALEGMLRTAPAHKSSEKFRGDIRLKIKKIKEKIIKDKERKRGARTKFSIKKGVLGYVFLVCSVFGLFAGGWI